MTIAVLGAGSWGTALAVLLSRNGFPVLLWDRDAKHLDSLQKQRENTRYLPHISLPDKLETHAVLFEAVARAETVLVAVPSDGFCELLTKLAPYLDKKRGLCWATKGLNKENGGLLSEAARGILGEGPPLAVLSGPTFAAEVAAGLPTAVTAASTNLLFAGHLADVLRNDSFRVYTSTDIIGVQVGGAAKNVIAIAAGIADGLGFGANTRAALITRGLHEITRLGMALGGKAETFMGLAGLGDLSLTCTDNQSRNRRFGCALGEGRSSAEARAQIDQVVEGIPATRQVLELSRRVGVEMPITEQVGRVLDGHCTPREAVHLLLTRSPKQEYMDL